MASDYFDEIRQQLRRNIDTAQGVAVAAGGDGGYLHDDQTRKDALALVSDSLRRLAYLNRRMPFTKPNEPVDRLRVGCPSALADYIRRFEDPSLPVSDDFRAIVLGDLRAQKPTKECPPQCPLCFSSGYVADPVPPVATRPATINSGVSA